MKTSMFILPLRGLQVLMAFIVLGLSGYGTLPCAAEADETAVLTASL